MALSEQMLEPRKAKAMSGASEAWYYIDPAAIQIYVSTTAGATSCRITRRQLLQALAVMDRHKKP